MSNPQTEAAEAAILATARDYLLEPRNAELLARWLLHHHKARPSLAAIARERARRAGRPDPTQETTRPHRGRDNERKQP